MYFKLKLVLSTFCFLSHCIYDITFFLQVRDKNAREYISNISRGIGCWNETKAAKPLFYFFDIFSLLQGTTLSLEQHGSRKVQREIKKKKKRQRWVNWSTEWHNFFNLNSLVHWVWSFFKPPVILNVFWGQYLNFGIYLVDCLVLFSQ